MQKKRTSRHDEGSAKASQVKESGKASTALSNPRNSTASAGVDASPLSRQSDLPATHANAETEKHSSPSESLPNTPPNVSLNAELPPPSGSSSRSASRSPKTPSEPMIDDASPRTKTGEAHLTPPSSPEPLHQSISSPESDQGAPEVPDATTPDSPKSPGHRFRSLLRKERKPSPDLDPVDDAELCSVATFISLTRRTSQLSQMAMLQKTTQSMKNVALNQPFVPSGRSAHRMSGFSHWSSLLKNFSMALPSAFAS